VPIGLEQRLARGLSGCGIVRARIARGMQVLNLDGPRDKNITRLETPDETREVKSRVEDTFGAPDFRFDHLCFSRRIRRSRVELCGRAAQ